MSTDYLTSVATKLLGLAPAIRPRVASRFEPLTSAAAPTMPAPAAHGDEEPPLAFDAIAPADRSRRPLPSVAEPADDVVTHGTEPADANAPRDLAGAVARTDGLPRHDRTGFPLDAHDLPDAGTRLTSGPQRSAPPRARVAASHHSSTVGERAPTPSAPSGSAPHETVATREHIPLVGTSAAPAPRFREAERRIDTATIGGDAARVANTSLQASAAGDRAAAPAALKRAPTAAPAPFAPVAPAVGAARETHSPSPPPSRVSAPANAVSVVATPVTAWAETSRRVAVPTAAHDRGESRHEPPIHVTIGRIEIRATPSAPVAPPPRRRPAVMGLDEYLRRKTGGDGR